MRVTLIFLFLLVAANLGLSLADWMQAHSDKRMDAMCQCKPYTLQMNWSETNIILAIIGMVGLFSTAFIWQRANRITSKYYGKR